MSGLASPASTCLDTTFAVFGAIPLVGRGPWSGFYSKPGHILVDSCTTTPHGRALHVRHVVMSNCAPLVVELEAMNILAEAFVLYRLGAPTPNIAPAAAAPAAAALSRLLQALVFQCQLVFSMRYILQFVYSPFVSP